MKYIDADRLNAEIERLYNGKAPKHDQQCDFDDGYFTGISNVFGIIDFLQQPEVDMKLTKQDYMRLPKERLAELLVERDTNEGPILPHRVFPFADPGSYKTPCYAPDGICTNPHHDCVNCPKSYSSSGTITKPNSI